MKNKICAVLALLMLLLSGCSGVAERNEDGTGAISLSNERLVKEFAGTVNIFHRAEDNLLLSSEEGEEYRYNEINIGTTEVRDSVLTELAGRYIYYEPIGSEGFVAVEGFDYKNTLKIVDRNGSEKVIKEDIGPVEVFSISISPKADMLIYTSMLENDSTYGLYIYDTKSSESRRLTDIKDDSLADGLNRLVSWSPDENNVIIQDKYIYNTHTGSIRGELKSSYSQWSPDGSKIAFILEDSSAQWLSTEDYHIYPGKKVCVYDVAQGSYEEVFKLTGDEYIFGDIAWSGNGSKLAFAGIQAEDMSQPDWYMKLNYSSVYLVELESRKSKRVETNVDATDGSMLELGNIRFTDQGKLLCFTVGNYEKSSLYVVDTDNLETKSFDNVEYLHWLEGESYFITAGKDSLYFCMDNSIMRIDEKLQDTKVYTSMAKLDDFYLSKEGKGLLLFELQDSVHIVRYIEE